MAGLLALLFSTIGQQPVTTLHVAVWDPMPAGAERAVRMLCCGFQLRYPDCRVAVMRQPLADAHSLVMRWCKAESGWRPDVVAVPDPWLGEMAAALEPLEDACLSRLRTLVHDSLQARLKIGGSLRAVPWWLEPRVLFYSARAVRDTKWQPASWDQVLETLSSVREKRRIWGLGVPGSGVELSQLFAEILWSLGGELVNDTGELDLLSAHCEEALDLLVRATRQGLTQPEILTWTQPELEELFANGKIAALVAPISLEDTLLDDKAADYGAAPLPGRPVFTSLIAQCFAVFGGGPRTATAKAFVEYVLSAEGQARIAEAGGLPLDPSLAKQTARTPARKAALQGMSNVRGLPPAKWQLICPAIERAAYLAISGRMTSPRALEEAQALIGTPLAQ